MKTNSKLKIQSNSSKMIFYLFLTFLLVCEVVVGQNQIRVRGIVTDRENNPLVGATVLIKGTTIGTATDINGKFNIMAKSLNDTLVVSYVGYTPKNVKISPTEELRIVLESDYLRLEEVVVVGYGVQKKSDLTGAIGSIKTSDFENEALKDINQTMMGKIAGVNVMNSQGTPGGGFDIQIRGLSTIGASANPLYVVDGNIIQESMDAESSPLAFLNPRDIESIEILKDASSAAIYGARASNGVVLITTKSGRKGKAKFTYNLKTGFQQAFNVPEMLSAREFAYLSMESRNNAWSDQGNSPYDSDELRGTNFQLAYFRDFLNSGKPGTDWLGAILRNAFFQDHQLAVNGGSDNLNYYFSANFLENPGIIKNTDFSRYSFRANVKAKLSRKLSLGVNLSPSYTDQHFLPTTGRYHDATAGIIQSALLENPILEIYDPNSYTGYSMGINQGHGLDAIENPVAKINFIKDWRRNFALNSNVYTSLDINRFFNLRLTGGAIIRSSQRNFINPSTIGAYSVRPPRDNSIMNNNLTSYNLQTSAQLTYKQNFGKHKLDGVAVYESQTQQDNNVIANASATWTDELIIVDRNLPNILRTGESYISEWALSSWIGRLNYNYDERYLISGSIRADGSSKFAKRWGTFPSGALAWRISNESFLKNKRWLHELKLRTSYGITGNNFIGNYEYMSFIGNASYVLGAGGETIKPGVQLSTHGNPDLTWEKTGQFNVGADISLFKRRLNFTVDYYDKRTKNLLLSLQTPANMGYTSILTNLGRIQNSGAEFSLDSRNITGAFKWNTSFNISFNKQKVLELGPEGDPLWGSSIYIENSHITEVGKPLGLFYGLKVIGIYQNQAQVDALPGIKTGAAISRPGEFIFEDVDKNGEITINDRTIIGDPHPDFTFGMTNNFSYRRFFLNIFLRGSYGADVLNFNFGNVRHTMRTNGHKSLINRWQSESEPGDGKTPRLVYNNNAVLGSTTLNSSYVEKGNFINIQNLTFGYDLPPRFLKKLDIEKLSLSISADNLFMFTGYTGFNPEGGIYVGSTLSPGLDWGKYPLSRTFTFGLNLTF